MTTTTLTHTAQASSVPVSAQDFRMHERVVLVTGAAKGDGCEFARQFAAAGAFSLVADIDLEKAASSS